MDYRKAIEYFERELNYKKMALSPLLDGKESLHEQYLKTAISAMQELQQYKQIGTLEEVREAVEKQQDKKIEIWNGQAMCPKCNALFGNMNDIKKLIAWEMPNCKFCGQKLDWSEEE